MFQRNKVKVRPKSPPNRKWILAAAAIIGLVAIGILFIEQITKKNGPPQPVQKIEKTEESKKVQFKSEEIPEDLRNIRAKIGKKKVKKNNKGFWEADYGDGIIMVYIPEGRIKIGSNDYYIEKPIHEVYLDGYWMGKTEVTVGQFRLFVEDKAYKTDAEKSRGSIIWSGKDWEMKKDMNWKNPGFKQDDNHPVVCVSWNDAKAYCDWLSTVKNLTFILPTEAQWEKAARGSDGRKYPWGDHKPYYNGKWYANYMAYDSWEKRGEDGFEFTAPVGSYPNGASPYGLLDMAGNVWEWCHDFYDNRYYYKSPDRNPQGPVSGFDRVLRGGSWNYEAVPLRCAGRIDGNPSTPGSVAGFRLCQDNRKPLE